MANPWPNIPPSSDAPSQAGRRQATARPNPNTTIQDCPCSWCSATRHSNPPLWPTTEYQNPQPPGVRIIVRWLELATVLSSDFGPPKDLAVPFTNQILSADNPTNIAAMMNDQQQAQSVAPQAYDTVGYAPLLEEARFLRAQTNAGLDQPQVINAQVTESLRHLAGGFVNNPESLVNVLRIEPGATGGFQVVIILEVVDIL